MSFFTEVIEVLRIKKWLVDELTRTKWYVPFYKILRRDTNYTESSSLGFHPCAIIEEMKKCLPFPRGGRAGS
jgi:hypothetical protein